VKVLIVLTSHERLGNTGIKTGFWLEEFAAPYYVLKDAGVEVTLASPQGGQPPVDPKSELPEWQTVTTRRFLADFSAQKQLASTKKLSEVSAKNFDAPFYPSGHGLMWDMPDNPVSIALLEAFLKAGKAIAGVCHGPAAFVNVRRPDGEYVVKGKHATAFSNCEERAVGLDKVVPFLLEDKLKERGALYNKGPDFSSHIQVDARLITGQNPASSEAGAEGLLEVLRFSPRRPIAA
jgi:putative intracellular protease/amidase